MGNGRIVFLYRMGGRDKEDEVDRATGRWTKRSNVNQDEQHKGSCPTRTRRSPQPSHVPYFDRNCDASSTGLKTPRSVMSELK
jgi:hypothetical protein